MAARPWAVVPGGVALTVRLTPRGGRDAIDGIEVLSDGRGGVVPASTVHHVALVELSDRFAAIATDHRQLI